MSAFWTLLVREIRRRLPAHLLSLGLALAAVGMPLLTGRVAGAHRSEIQGAVAVGLALLWSLSLAFIEGLGFLSGDLREGRLGFDFRLPVPAVSIWAARFLAAALSIKVAALLVLGIAAIFGADLAWGLKGLLELTMGHSGLALDHPLVVMGLFLLAVLLALDLVGLALASRKAWFGLDVASAAAFKSLAFLAIVPLWRLGAESEAGFVFLAAVSGGLLALGIATLRQVVAGRTEADRAHRAFSVAFASVALLAVLPLSTWSRWYRTAGLEDLVPEKVSASSLTEDLVWISGPARHRGELFHPFLFEPKSGWSLSLGAHHAEFARSPARISLDRSRVAWLSFERQTFRSWTSRVRYLDLDRRRDPAEVRESGIEWDGVPFAWALSPDGSRIASVWRNESSVTSLRLRLEGLETAGQESVLTIEKCGSHGRMIFLDRRTLLYDCGWASPQSDMHSAYTVRIDLETGESVIAEETPHSDRPPGATFAVATGRWFQPPPERWAAPHREPGRLHVAGREPVEISIPESIDPTSRVLSTRFLPDGRLVVVWPKHRASLFAIYDDSGRLLRTIPVDLISARFFFCAQEGSWFVGAWQEQQPNGGLKTTLYRLSESHGSLVEIADNLRPIPPGSSASPTTLFATEDSKLLLLDPTTGSLSPLTAAF